MPEIRLLRPSNWDDFPPNWMRPEVEQLLELTAAARLWTRVNNGTAFFAWAYFDDGRPAEPIDDHTDSSAWILIERGYLTTADRKTLKTESGETFTAERVVFTPAGRELHEKLLRLNRPE